MKKSSIYSNRYGKSKKRVHLRRNLILILTTLVLFLLFFLPYLDGKVKEFKANGNQFPNQAAVSGHTTPSTVPTKEMGTTDGSTQGLGAATNTKGEKTNTTNTPSTTGAQAAHELSLTHRLPDGGDLRIDYEQSNGTIRYLDVVGEEGAYTFDISPKEDQVLINASADQSLIVYDEKLKAVDHSVNTYNHSRKGALWRSVYSKKSDFVWMGNARFMSEKVILFESQMSRTLDKTYIWYYRIPDRSYGLISGTGSETTKLLKPVEKGFEIQLDGEILLITPELKVGK